MVNNTPLPTHLPEDVIRLMERTIVLVDLIYWKPTQTRGSKRRKGKAPQKAPQQRASDRIRDLLGLKRAGQAG
jgi:hypothetical protein